jgi:hypothetical protein
MALALAALLGTTSAASGQAVTQRAQPVLTRAQQHAKHQALWAQSRACLVQPSAGPARAIAVEGAPPRAVSPYSTVALEGLPAVAIIEGRIATVTPAETADGLGVFTDYELVVTRVAQNSALLPVAAGGTVLITRPGGEVERGGARKTVSVAGYPRLEVGASVLVTLLAIPDAGSYQEISLRPAGGKEGR